MKTIVALNMIFRQADHSQLRRLLLCLKSSIIISSSRMISENVKKNADIIRESITSLFSKNTAKISLALNA